MAVISRATSVVVMITRRTALAVLSLGVTGCAGSPVIVGDPGTAPTPAVPPPPPEPTRGPEAEAAHVAVARLRALLDALLLSPYWEAQAWTAASIEQCDEYLRRMSSEDPLSPAEGEGAFEVEIGAALPPSDPIVAMNRLNDTVAHAVDALERAAIAADTAEMRLLYTSMSAAVLGMHEQGVVPIQGEGAPRSLQATTVEASLPVLLGHVWALIYGLGVGLGNLAPEDPLHAVGVSRLAESRRVRNELRDELGPDAPEQPAAFEMPTAMDSPEAIGAAWGVLEARIMDGYGRLVAADPDPRWRTAMRGQVEPVQATGTALAWWPGWVA